MSALRNFLVLVDRDFSLNLLVNNMHRYLQTNLRLRSLFCPQEYDKRGGDRPVRDNRTRQGSCTKSLRQNVSTRTV